MSRRRVEHRMILLLFVSAIKPAARRRGTGGPPRVFGAEKNSRPAPLSTTRPRCSSTTSPASRCAWPRSCVDITTLMPRAATARMTSSTALVAAGSRLAVGSSRNSTSGSRASARASASRCCSPPESRRAGRSPSPLKADQRQQFGDARSRARRAARRRRRAHSGYCRRRCGGASPGAGTRWRGAPARTRSRPPQVTRPARRLDEPHGEAHERGLAGAVRPDQHGRRARRERRARCGRGSSASRGAHAHVCRAGSAGRWRARAWSSREPFAGAPHAPGERVDDDDDRRSAPCRARSRAAGRPSRFRARSRWSWCG